MCGRISFSFNRADLLATYAWLRDAPDEDARYNIAPTDPVVAVGPHSADVVRWGIDGRKGGLRRLPVAVSRVDGKLLNLAGLLGSWQGQLAATILTTAPNGDIAPLHNRMPVALNDDDAATWVLEDLSLEQIADFLKPCPDGWLRLAPASPLVNDVRNQGPELLDPHALPPHFQLELMPPA